MAALAAFAGANMDGAAVRVEVADLKGGKFAISRAGLEGGLDHPAEIRFGRVDQPAGLVDREISNPCSVSITQRRDGAPSIVRSDLLLSPGVVECRLKDGQCAVSGGSPTTGILVRIVTRPR